MTVKIPSGVDSGSHLRLSGEGEPGERGGPPGNLFVVLSTKPHDFFERHEDDILCQIPISFPQATLGAEVEVPTLDGKTKLNIPSGTQNGDVFRLKKKGIHHLHGFGKGDQIVQVIAKTPTNLTKRQIELLKEFAEEAEKNQESEKNETHNIKGKKKKRF